MNQQALSPYEQAVLHGLARIAAALDRNTIARANGPKPQLTDAEAAARFGFQGEHPQRFMDRLKRVDVLKCTHGGHARTWCAASIDALFATAFENGTDVVPSSLAKTVHGARTSRKQRASQNAA